MNTASPWGMHCLVSGLVQGVSFRMAARGEAQRLGLTGWARNLPDGRVELQAFGPVARLDELRAWLQRGPALAKVVKCDCQAIEFEAHVGFEIAATPCDID